MKTLFILGHGSVHVMDDAVTWSSGHGGYITMTHEVARKVATVIKGWLDNPGRENSAKEVEFAGLEGGFRDLTVTDLANVERMFVTATYRVGESSAHVSFPLPTIIDQRKVVDLLLA